MTNTVILSLGSNLGDREGTLRSATAAIAAIEGLRIEAGSALFETLAVTLSGVDEASPAYLNAVLKVTTTLSPETLLAGLAVIETEHGRVREERWGDRTLDIDIVSYGSVVQDDPHLTLPHPRAAERSFVLVPWLDIDPDAALPNAGRIDGLPAAHESVSRYPAEALA